MFRTIPQQRKCNYLNVSDSYVCQITLTCPTNYNVMCDVRYFSSSNYCRRTSFGVRTWVAEYVYVSKRRLDTCTPCIFEWLVTYWMLFNFWTFLNCLYLAIQCSKWRENSWFLKKETLIYIINTLNSDFNKLLVAVWAVQQFLEKKQSVILASCPERVYFLCNIMKSTLQIF